MLIMIIITITRISEIKNAQPYAQIKKIQITPKKIKNGMASNLIITSVLTNLF